MRIAHIDWISAQNKSAKLDAKAKECYHFCGGNTGNLVHINSYNKILDGHSLTHCNFVDVDLINSQDLLLVKCANQIGKHHPVNKGIIFDNIEKIKIPIILCCLGAQNKNFDNLDILPADSLWPELLKIVSSKRFSPDYPNISVRGEYSQKVLQFYGVESTVTGCISTTLFKDKLGTYLKNKYKNKNINNICVAGNNPYNPGSAWLEKELKIITENYNGIHIAQSPVHMFSLIHGEELEIPDIFPKVYNMNNEEIRRWFIRYGKMFYNTDHWSSVIKLYDLVIGTRYHGVAIGLQNDVLGTIFTIDSRTEELAKTNGIKHINVKNLQNKNYQEILEMSMWDEKDYEHLDNQVTFCKNQFIKFFQQNSITLNTNPID